MSVISLEGDFTTYIITSRYKGSYLRYVLTYYSLIIFKCTSGRTKYYCWK